MKKKSFTKACRVVGISPAMKRYFKKAKSKARRRCSDEDVKAFDRKFTSAWDIS